MAAFAYDALERMISAQVRYDTDVNSVAETTKFYYDGSDVIAEYDMSDTIQRRYVHGARGVDVHVAAPDHEVLDDCEASP